MARHASRAAPRNLDALPTQDMRDLGIKVAVAAVDEFRVDRAQAGLETDADRILAEAEIEGPESAAAVEPMEAPVTEAEADPAVSAFQTWREAIEGCRALDARQDRLCALLFPEMVRTS